jgi:hypothetical protein
MTVLLHPYQLKNPYKISVGLLSSAQIHYKGLSASKLGQLLICTDPVRFPKKKDALMPPFLLVWGIPEPQNEIHLGFMTYLQLGIDCPLNRAQDCLCKQLILVNACRHHACGC